MPLFHVQEAALRLHVWQIRLPVLVRSTVLHIAALLVLAQLHATDLARDGLRQFGELQSTDTLERGQVVATVT